MEKLRFLSGSGGFYKTVILLAAGVGIGLFFQQHSQIPTTSSTFEYNSASAQNALKPIVNSTTNTQDLNADSDNDGLSNTDELIFNSSPNDPDTDGDGYQDGQEIANGYSPTAKSPSDKILTIPSDNEIIITTESSATAIQNYFSQSQTPALLKDAMIYQQMIKDAQAGDNKKLNEIIKAMQDSQAMLKKISAPSEVKLIHKLSIGIMQPIIDSFINLRDIKSNPETLDNFYKEIQLLAPFSNYLKSKTDIIKIKYNLTNTND
ncbi:MAG: hypothetical protein COU81_01480 [Candidatus Portnoybacteria bacterium CG10_big_fil_rev_8_21_14_0_10_36_7]|uniref:Uncharacterized protein n=1 Tax=Candidatus Portnoybacteria bacterium CG10_big_fil_rev_8_21_14_0_10_36_7 TaxID=1974812 RepID=A0A2M8KEF5_9BACT|nr:MAG: hypothetical protein COU81_01480 [Candidatus Portnoybacteria bacterium CG10_big_fil_rev_8_21_14_0_10_36_7]